jgi:SET domain-containing protein
MNRFALEIQDSLIPFAGMGLFTKEFIPQKSVIIFPNEENLLLSSQELEKFPVDSIEQQSAVRWFEDLFTIDPKWSLESHLNHSFNPNCLWYLGFVFAKENIQAGSELTIDYRHLLEENFTMDFNDSLTQLPITGLPWAEKMCKGAKEIQELFHI